MFVSLVAATSCRSSQCVRACLSVCVCVCVLGVHTLLTLMVVYTPPHILPTSLLMSCTHAAHSPCHSANATNFVCPSMGSSIHPLYLVHCKMGFIVQKAWLTFFSLPSILLVDRHPSAGLLACFSIRLTDSRTDPSLRTFIFLICNFFDFISAAFYILVICISMCVVAVACLTRFACLACFVSWAEPKTFYWRSCALQSFSGSICLVHLFFIGN